MRLGMSVVQKQTLNQNLLMRVIQTSAFYQLSSDEVDSKVDEAAEQNPALRKVNKASGATARRYLRPPDEALTPIEDRTGASDTLVQTLLAEFRLVRATEAEQMAAQYILGSLDERGFLMIPLAQMADETGLSLPTFTSARDKIMRNLEPEGCGADDLKHFLIFMFIQRFNEDPFVEELVTNHLEDLWRGRFNIIEDAMDMDPEDAEEYREMLSDLPPFPAQGYVETESQYVEPSFEVVTDEDSGAWVVHMLREKRKEVELNTDFIAKAAEKTGDEKKEAEKHLREARDLLKQLEDRQTLLEQVAVRAVEAQQAFFHRGPDFLLNLTRSAIATEIGVDDSQVSRLVKGEYFLWRGTTHSLGELFTYRRVRGDNTSAPQLKAILRDIIDNEDKRAPLSDRAIMEEFARRGVRCQLRTVNKYRRILNVPSSHKRRVRDAD
ncbi:MAG: hypothetical protein ACON5B_10090 [Myxococcota bacterium]